MVPGAAAAKERGAARRGGSVEVRGLPHNLAAFNGTIQANDAIKVSVRPERHCWSVAVRARPLEHQRRYPLSFW